MKKLIIASFILVAAAGCQSEIVQPAPVDTNLGYVQVQFVYMDGTSESSQIVAVK